MAARIAAWLLRPRRLVVIGLVMFMWGFLSTMLSGICGLDELRIPIEGTAPAREKEVGYLSAVNWWPNYTVVLPALMFFLAWMIGLIERTHDDFVGAGMVWNTRTNSPDPDGTRFREAWLRLLTTGVRWWFAFALLAIAYSGWECWDNSIEPILRESDAGKERDWAVATLISGSDVSPAANIFFSVFVFALQGFGISMALILLVVSITYAVFLTNSGGNEAGFVLVPDCSSEDPRRGFERFEDLGTVVLGNALLAYLALYFVILQNQYLRSDAGSIWEMPYGPFALHASIDNHSNVGALMMGLLLILAVVVLLPGVALGLSARRARSRYEAMVGGRTECTERMVWWPYSWLKVNVLLTAVALAVISLFVPSVAPYLLALFSVTLVSYLALRIRSMFK